MIGRFFPVFALALAVAGCSSSSTDGGGNGSGTNGGNDAGSTSSSLKAPAITEVMPMAGALHVTWTNNQTDCDTVEGESKMMGMGDYAAAFSVPGTVNNKMDTAATSNMTFMYRLRCKKGGAYSAYSNEMGGNPMQGMDGGMDMDSGMNMDGGMGMD